MMNARYVQKGITIHLLQQIVDIIYVVLVFYNYGKFKEEFKYIVLFVEEKYTIFINFKYKIYNIMKYKIIEYMKYKDTITILLKTDLYLIN